MKPLLIAILGLFVMGAGTAWKLETLERDHVQFKETLFLYLEAHGKRHDAELETLTTLSDVMKTCGCKPLGTKEEISVQAQTVTPEPGEPISGTVDNWTNDGSLVFDGTSFASGAYPLTVEATENFTEEKDE